MWWGSGYYGDGYGYGYYGSQIVLVIVVLIVGCLFLCCMLGVFWYLYSQKRNERTESSNVQYYPYYVPPATRIGKDGELGTQFR
ncbi:unnamed protein product [Meloidogyne enterolobii]|uniref:Uncharacterized protein n=3 Tax=Meloidogyne TaxID=189290 RepID=A0A6V7XKU6_MELEN|nr:unnamed protein product [Meloidogyne enterolobii]CAD2199888.1 unnamed protein product [Meloidogyne enterolobii]